jgi:hypothetical protein
MVVEILFIGGHSQVSDGLAHFGAVSSSPVFLYKTHTICRGDTQYNTVHFVCVKTSLFTLQSCKIEETSYWSLQRTTL